eukprot:862646-Pyramimonas_sp.AAC.2
MACLCVASQFCTPDVRWGSPGEDPCDRTLIVMKRMLSVGADACKGSYDRPGQSAARGDVRTNDRCQSDEGADDQVGAPSVTSGLDPLRGVQAVRSWRGAQGEVGLDTDTVELA